MSDADDEQPLLKKSYLVLLGLALVVMLMLNPGVFRKLLPQREATVHMPAAGKAGESASGASVATNEYAGMAAIRQDVNAFNDWFMNESNAPAVNIVIMRAESFQIERLDVNPTQSRTLRYGLVHHCARGGGLATEDLRGRLTLQSDSGLQVRIGSIKAHASGTNFTVTVHVDGVGRVGLEVDALPPVYYDVNIPRLWPVDIRGTFHDADAGWLALFGNRTLRPGAVIPPDDIFCGYQVLNVSRRCVWLLAFADENRKQELPPLRWPDLERIVLSSDREPQQIELRPGIMVRPGQSIDFRRTRARMTVDRLWSNAVHFRYQPSGSGEVLDLLCVLVQ